MPRPCLRMQARCVRLRGRRAPVLGGPVPRLMLPLLLLFGCAWVSGAQGPADGALQGSVLDEGGGAVSGAAITITYEATDTRASLRSDGHGAFSARHLTPGGYRVRVAAPGFAPVTNAVAVTLGSVVAVDVRLRAAATIAVEVRATDVDPGLLSPEAVAGGVISSLAFAELPLPDRRWQSFALLLPEVNPGGEQASETGLESVRGLAVTQNALVFDGVSGDQSYSGTPAGSGTEGPEEADVEDTDADSQRSYGQGGGRGVHPGAAYVISAEAVGEFRVAAQNGSAVDGHAAGGVITAVSRGGGNRAHGGAFFLLRESAWAATNPYAAVTHFRDGVVSDALVKPQDVRQQFGGSVGGPLRRDRLFGFFATDEQRHGYPAESSPADPNFYTLTPMQTALLGNRGVRASQITAALNYLDSLTGRVERRADQSVNFARLDWTPSGGERLAVEWNRARSTAPAGLRTAPVVNRGRGSFGNAVIRVDSVIGRWTATPWARVSNELRVQYGRDLHRESAQAPLPGEPAISVGGLPPEVAIGPDGLAFGTPAGESQGPAPLEHRAQLAEVVTLGVGHHLLQVGGDFSWVHDHVELLPNAEGSFRYDSGVTGGHAGGLVDWITDFSYGVNSYPNGACPSIFAPVHDGCFRSFTQSFGPRVSDFSTGEWAGYVQDDWRARPNLTLRLGLRYDYEFLPLPQAPNAALDAVFGTRGASGVFPEDRNNFGPRVSVAWQPLGVHRGTVRVAYGLYYGRVPGSTVRSALADTATASSTTRIRITPTAETECPQVSGQGFGYPCAYLAAPPAGIVATTSATVFDRRFRTPMLQQGTFALERELGRGFTASASYLVNLNRQLPNSVDMNIAPATGTRSFALQGGTGQPGVRDGTTFVVPLYTERMSTGFGPVTDIRSDANGTYHALALEAHGRRGPLELRAAWTWSKAIDYGQNAGGVPPVNGQFDPYTLGYDRAVSSLNYPHRIVVNGVWSPTVRGSGLWTRRLLNGWSVGAVGTEASGRPYSYQIFGGTRLSGGHESINGAGGLQYLPTVGRNTLRLADSANVDARLNRTVRAGERVRVRAFVEVFNLANHVNPSSVSERAYLVGAALDGATPLVFQDAATVAAEGLNVRPFGATTEAATGSQRERQVQVGLRVEF